MQLSEGEIVNPESEQQKSFRKKQCFIYNPYKQKHEILKAQI